MKIRKIWAAAFLLVMLLLASTVTVFAAETTAAAEEGWVKRGSVYKWRQADGTILKEKGWHILGGKKYYLYGNGVRKTGWFTDESGRYYLSKTTNIVNHGAVCTGKRNIGGKTYYFSKNAKTLGKLKTGQIKIGGKYYYFDASAGGAMVKSKWVTIKGSKYYFGKDGYRLTGIQKIGGKSYYLGTDGKLVVSRHGIKIGKNYYKINAKGVLTKVSEVAGLAGIRVDEEGGTLVKAFRWSAKLRYFGAVGTPAAGQEAVDYYALYGFKNNRGDCNVMAATFYWMAKVLGQQMEFVQGSVPQANGVYGNHAWCEKKVGSLYYFYDPNAKAAGKTGWKFLYGTPNSYAYKDSHGHTVQYQA